MRTGGSLPHRTIGGHEQDESICLLKQGAWMHAFMPVPGVAGTGQWGTQGRLVAGPAPLGSDPHPHGQQARGSGPQVGRLDRVKSLLPPLGVLGMSDESGEPRVQLGATWGGCSFWNSALFWPSSSALGLDSGLGAGQELFRKGCPQRFCPSHPHPTSQPDPFCCLLPLSAPRADLR